MFTIMAVISEVSTFFFFAVGTNEDEHLWEVIVRQCSTLLNYLCIYHC